MITAVRERRPLRSQVGTIARPERPAAILPLVAIVRQLAEVVAGMTDEQYTMKPVGVVPSSLGGHVRHCLDHIDALLIGVENGVIDYDARRRGTAVETSRLAALEAIRRQVRQLLDFSQVSESQALRLLVMLTSTSHAMEVETSLGRELAFVLSHTIHHEALIGVMAKMLGVPLPERFGYAPSTIAHLEKSTCAQ